MACITTLDELAKLLRGTRNGPWINIRGPGHSTNDRSLGIRIDPTAPGGFRVNSLAHDDESECREYVKSLLHHVPAETFQDVYVSPDTDSGTQDSARMANALALWDQASPIEGTIVERYLAARRCQITEPYFVTDALRFHSRCPFGQARVPAMLALIQDVETKQPKAVLRTALRDDGFGKRDMPAPLNSKMILGTASRGAVMLFARAPVMGVAEGVETAISASRLFNIPVWATTSAVAMSGLPVIAGVRHLTVFADHDTAGLDAAEQCASRFHQARVNGEIKYPKKPGTDWNDVIRGDKNYEIR